uniref:BRCT domain-containing protein n=1 Tax=Parascaris univalens TaxID=6257 RepID=A0A915ANC7_PARUN
MVEDTHYLAMTLLFGDVCVRQNMQKMLAAGGHIVGHRVAFDDDVSEAVFSCVASSSGMRASTVPAQWPTYPSIHAWMAMGTEQMLRLRAPNSRSGDSSDDSTIADSTI